MLGLWAVEQVLSALVPPGWAWMVRQVARIHFTID